MKQNRAKITFNIIMWIVLLYLIQSALILFLYDKLAISNKLYYLFFPVSLIMHISIAVILVKMRSYFYLEHNKIYLNHVNVANLLTISRLSSLPTICLFLVMYGEKPQILPILILITIFAFLTDLLDGTISRLTKQVTQMGRFLDSTSDYLIIGFVSITFIIIGLLPLWFFCLIITRLAAHTISMFIIRLRQGWVKPDSSFLGKASIFATMTLYVGELVKLFGLQYRFVQIGIIVLEVGAGIIVALSIIDKAIYTYRKNKSITETKKAQSIS